MTTLSNVETLALTKAIATKDEKAARTKIEPGSYLVDYTVRVRGTVKVSADYQKTPTVSIPLIAVLNVLIRRNGAVGEASINYLRDILTEAMQTGQDASELLETSEKAVEMVRNDLLAKLPKTTSQGPGNTDLSIEVIEDEVLQAA